MDIASLLVAALTTLQPPSPAAVNRPRGYAFTSIAFAYHPPSSVYYRNVITPVGGGGMDLSGGGGAFVRPALGIEGEFVYGGTISTPQFTFFEEKARDVMLNALVRF